MTEPPLQFSWITPENMSALPIEKSQFPHIFPANPHQVAGITYLVAARKGKIEAIAATSSTPGTCNIHLHFVEVAETARHRGTAKALYTYLFDMAHAQHKAITGDGYTDMGKSYLLKVISEGQKKYGMEAYQHIGRV